MSQGCCQLNRTGLGVLFLLLPLCYHCGIGVFVVVFSVGPDMVVVVVEVVDVIVGGCQQPNSNSGSTSKKLRSQPTPDPTRNFTKTLNPTSP